MDMFELGTVLAKRRAELRLTQQDLAEMSTVTARTIYDVERGKGNPSFGTLVKLLSIVGLELNAVVKNMDK